MASYCPNCGTKLKENAAFCQSCGESAEVQNGYAVHYEVKVPRPGPPKHLPFSCMLAYIPGLFWLPLLADHNSNTHRECANQGLITPLFVGLTLENYVSRLPAMLFWVALTAIVMYVPVNSMCGVAHSMGSERPYCITLFGRLRFIGPKYPANES